MITPEQAFEKLWQKHKEELTGVPTIYNQKHAMRLGFNHGQQYQKTNQLMVLADIRKAVGDPEGRLIWEELVKRIEGLVKQVSDLQCALLRSQLVVAGLSSAASVVTEDQWQTIESAPKDGTEILGWRDDCGVFVVRYCSAEDFLSQREMENWSDDLRQSLDWFCADFAHGERLEGDLIPTHWMPLPDGPVKSVTTEKEEA